MVLELTKEQVIFLKESNAEIKYCDINPKMKNSKSWQRFEEYKSASNMKEYFALGGNMLDFKYDFSRGFVALPQGKDIFAGFVQPLKSNEPASVQANGRKKGADFDEKPKRKRLRGVSKPNILPAFAGSVSPPSINLIDLNRPTVDEFYNRCVKPSVPAILRNLTSEGALSLGTTSNLRAKLVDVLDSTVEVGIVDRGEIFHNNETRREATCMKIGHFLDLMELPTSVASKEDFYLIQCPFLSNVHGSNRVLPLAALAEVLKPPSCIAESQLHKVEGNLWACHREALTTTHFDGRDNILMVLKGYKEVTLWSPSETKRHGISRVSAQQVGIADLVSRHLNKTHLTTTQRSTSTDEVVALELKPPSHIDWPSLPVLSPIPTGSKVIITVYPGESLFIPEGWYHQVRSEAGTVAVNFWFEGLACRILDERPHSIPYLIRTMTTELLEQLRGSLVGACRNQSKIAQNGQSVEFSSAVRIHRLLEECPTTAIALMGKHMSVGDMFKLLPPMVQTHPVIMWRALSCATPWAIELLTGTWSTANEAEASLFYSDFFEGFGEEADQVRSLIFEKKEEFGRRMIPLLFHDIGVFQPLPVSSTTSEMSDLDDMTEVRSLLVLLGDHQLFRGAGIDGGDLKSTC